MNYLEVMEEARESGKAFRNVKMPDGMLVSITPGQVLPADRFWSKTNARAALANGGSLTVVESCTMVYNGEVEMGWKPSAALANDENWVIVEYSPMFYRGQHVEMVGKPNHRATVVNIIEAPKAVEGFLYEIKLARGVQRITVSASNLAVIENFANTVSPDSYGPLRDRELEWVVVNPDDYDDIDYVLFISGQREDGKLELVHESFTPGNCITAYPSEVREATEEEINTDVANYGE